METAIEREQPNIPHARKDKLTLFASNCSCIWILVDFAEKHNHDYIFSTT